jgi:hypothetical protein
MVELETIKALESACALLTRASRIVAQSGPLALVALALVNDAGGKVSAAVEALLTTPEPLPVVIVHPNSVVVATAQAGLLDAFPEGWVPIRDSMGAPVGKGKLWPLSGSGEDTPESVRHSQEANSWLKATVMEALVFLAEQGQSEAKIEFIRDTLSHWSIVGAFPSGDEILAAYWQGERPRTESDELLR